MDKNNPRDWEELVRRFQRAVPKIPDPPIIKIPDSALAAISALTREFQGQVARIERFAANTALPALEAWQLRVPDLSRWAEIGDALVKAARVWREEFIAAQPPNWLDLGDEDLAFSVVEKIQETKVCLVWLPRHEVLRRILDAPATEALTILLAHKDDILEDGTKLLDDATSLAFALERDAARDSISAFRDGHYRAAQALAGTTFTSTCHVWFDQGGTGRIAEAMRTLPDRAAISQLRIVSIFEAAEPALRAFNPLHAKPRFTFFNRHNTAHRVTAEQFTEANALAAIMLAVALLREVEEWPQEPGSS